MAIKLSSKQQQQLTFLQSLPPKFEQITKVISLMEVLQADDMTMRGLYRNLDSIKAHASQLGLGSLSDTTGQMAALARRTGSVQTRVRGLRELLGSLKIRTDGAIRAASTPEAETS
jgi:hypothetical protein